MSALGIPQAAGITGMLTADGLRSAEVHAWFSQPRRELAGLTPGELVRLREFFPSAGQVLLRLAQHDIRDRLARDGTEPHHRSAHGR